MWLYMKRRMAVSMFHFMHEWKVQFGTLCRSTLAVRVILVFTYGRQCLCITYNMSGQNNRVCMRFHVNGMFVCIWNNVYVDYPS
jgi:hypothetical protein